MNPLQLHPTVDALLRRGVKMPAPYTVDVANDVNPNRIATGCVIHAGCRIRGAETSIGPDCVIGAEAPATIEDCQLGSGVSLAGGYFAGATFMDGSSVGSCAHVRPSTLLEEQASCAHSVGLKQTLLMPFVVTGSLVNFCDCLMAGGTGRKNHSEVGSSYVHFNFTPHGDKATPSLIGDVPRGVLLDQAPIFLGGQGGLVGPVRVAYGTVIAAGTVWRRDVLEPGMLLTAGSGMPRALRYDPSAIPDLSRVAANNLAYIGNLHALLLWYRHVRTPLFDGDALRRHLFEGALRRLDGMVAERIKRLDELAARLPAGDGGPSQHTFNSVLRGRWPALLGELQAKVGKDQFPAARDNFLAKCSMDGATDYLAAVGSLHAEARAAATAWLQAEVDAIAGLCPGVD
jgi:UDP-N-acetylglucosamine/UDP-N-acetylgalactosamine diphosphorylase